MVLDNINIGFAITGAFETFDKIIPKIKELVDNGANVYPILSFNSSMLNTRFGDAKNYINKIQSASNRKIINTIQEAEFLISKDMIDIMVISPATGNTIAKITYGISDTPVTVASKLASRNNRPIVIGIYAVDGLSTNAANIGMLLNRKNYYFIPFRQSNPITKPYSITFDNNSMLKTIEYAIGGEQMQPILI